MSNDICIKDINNRISIDYSNIKNLDLYNDIFISDKINSYDSKRKIKNIIYNHLGIIKQIILEDNEIIDVIYSNVSKEISLYYNVLQIKKVTIYDESNNIIAINILNKDNQVIDSIAVDNQFI